MNRSMFRTLVAALGLAVLTSISLPAHADNLGRFNGFCQNNLVPAVQKPAFFDIFTERNRRFQGILEISDPIPHLFPIDGTISASNNINGNGMDQQGRRITFHGKLRALGVREAALEVGAVRYAIWGDRLMEEEGIFCFIKMLGGANWNQMQGANVDGALRGMYFPMGGKPGDLDAELRNVKSGRGGATTEVKGRHRFFAIVDRTNNSFFDVFLDIEGTVGHPPDPGRPVPIGMIGVDPSDPNSRGIIAILIGLLLPAVQNQPRMIVGQYMLFDSFFDVFTEISTGRNTSFNQGTFLLPYIEQDN